MHAGHTPGLPLRSHRGRVAGAIYTSDEDDEDTAAAGKVNDQHHHTPNIHSDYYKEGPDSKKGYSHGLDSLIEHSTFMSRSPSVDFSIWGLAWEPSRWLEVSGLPRTIDSSYALERIFGVCNIAQDLPAPDTDMLQAFGALQGQVSWNTASLYLMKTGYGLGACLSMGPS